MKTTGESGVIAWWKDEKNQVAVGLDRTKNTWFLRTLTEGKELVQSYALPDGFRWGVYHYFRIERQEGNLKVWLDEIPTPGKSVFEGIIPADEPGLPGVFDKTQTALFDGAVYTIGFDMEQLGLQRYSEMLKGDLLTDYEVGFQLDGLSGEETGICYPIYVDAKNYVRVCFNSQKQQLELQMVKKGKKILVKEYALQARKTVYPDIKYTDFIEKTYRFKAPTQFDALYLSRHEISDKSKFVKNMFDHFNVEYLSNEKWLPIPTQNVAVDSHPAYNVLSFAPVKAEGVRFINKNPQDLDRHIYKIGLHEQWKDSYHFRAVRRAGKLYIFVDGQEFDNIEVAYPASKIGFCASDTPSLYKGVLYYHIGDE